MPFSLYNVLIGLFLVKELAISLVLHIHKVKDKSSQFAHIETSFLSFHLDFNKKLLPENGDKF